MDFGCIQNLTFVSLNHSISIKNQSFTECLCATVWANHAGFNYFLNDRTCQQFTNFTIDYTVATNTSSKFCFTTVPPLQPATVTTQSITSTTTPGQLSWNSTGVTVATGNGNTAVLNPFGVFVDDNYYIYVAEKSNSRISKWPPNPTGSLSAAVLVTANGELNQPPSLYVDSTTGDIYVADEGNRRVRRFANGSTTGTNVVSPSAGATPNVNAIFLSPNRTIYITDSSNFRIYDWLTNVAVAGGNGAGSSNTHLNSPRRFFIDRNFNIYIPENVNHRVMKWALGASSGQVVAGGNGGGNAAGQLNAPLGVAVSSQGDVLVCDTNNNRIQLWRSGAVTGQTIAGDSGGSSGTTSTRFNSPKGIAIDKDDNIYVVDGNNLRIQKFNAIH